MDDDGLGYADEGEEEDWDTEDAPQLHHTARSKKKDQDKRRDKDPSKPLFMHCCVNAPNAPHLQGPHIQAEFDAACQQHSFLWNRQLAVLMFQGLHQQSERQRMTLPRQEIVSASARCSPPLQVGRSLYLFQLG